MQKEILELLNPRKNGIYVDATVGLGGHAAGILRRIGKDGRLIGIDRDARALGITKKRLSDERVILKKGNFSDMIAIVSEEGISEIDGIIFDLGVSMLQIKDSDRGFSFTSDARLDMRMDISQRLTAWDVVNTYSEREIERILREFGEERFSKRIARSIVAHRKKKPIDTCYELSKIIEGICPRRGRIHPATKTFQALRIEVNRELDELREGLNASIKILNPGGRLCVLSYQSLEDRMVKRFISENSQKGILKKLTRKPLTPSQEELKLNPSSRSAKLRAAERI